MFNNFTDDPGEAGRFNRAHLDTAAELGRSAGL